MKKTFLLIFCLCIINSPVLADYDTNDVDPVDSLYIQPSVRNYDDYTQAQSDYEELREYRPDLDEWEDNGNTCEYGYDGSDGSSKSY